MILVHGKRDLILWRAGLKLLRVSLTDLLFHICIGCINRSCNHGAKLGAIADILVLQNSFLLVPPLTLMTARPSNTAPTSVFAVTNSMATPLILMPLLLRNPRLHRDYATVNCAPIDCAVYKGAPKGGAAWRCF